MTFLRAKNSSGRNISRNPCEHILTIFSKHGLANGQIPNNYKPSMVEIPKLLSGACISARITTVIHWPTIKSNYTDIMSCLRPRKGKHNSKKLMLTHAWLNLSNEHMTTGRINQIGAS